MAGLHWKSPVDPGPQPRPCEHQYALLPGSHALMHESWALNAQKTRRAMPGTSDAL